MKIVIILCRVLLGLMFVVFGLNGFFHFLPMGPMPSPDSAEGKWMGVMMETGWMHCVSFFQVLGAVLVLIGGTTPMGLLILGPIIVNILIFHAVLMSGLGIGIGLFAALLEIALIWAYRANFAGIFTTKAAPTL